MDGICQRKIRRQALLVANAQSRIFKLRVDPRSLATFWKSLWAQFFTGRIGERGHTSSFFTPIAL
jgi:hypothetical protein